MKIYTKKGDKGTTSLIGGTRVPKHHLRIESYGTVDELNSWIGVLRDQPASVHLDPLLEAIQNQLFVVGSHLANDPEKSKMTLPELSKELIKELESSIDELEKELPALQNFVLPGGHVSASFGHVARCVCRRAERCVTALHEISDLDEEILPFLNRLSDWLFIFSRYLIYQTHSKETLWQTRT